MLGIDAVGESFSQLVSKRPGLFVTGGSVGCDHHGADVAKVDGLDARNRSLGAVAPFGSLERRCQLFGEGDERLALDLRHALGGRLVVHAIDGLTHARHTALEDFFGEGLLDRRQCLEGYLPMGASGTQARSLGTGRRLLALAAGPLVAAVASTTAFPIATASASTTVVAVTASTATSTTSTIVVATASTAALRREHLSDQGLVASAAEHLERLGFLASALGRKNGGDGEAIEVGISLHLHDITHRCAGRQEGPVERALGLLGSGRTPGPLPVAAVGGEFDVKPSCHGENGIGLRARHRLRSGNDQLTNRSVGSVFPPQTTATTRSPGSGR